MITVLGNILQRVDTTESWEYVNPILPDKQLGWERDIYGTPIGVKMGDGVRHWDDLPYWFNLTEPGSALITQGVTSTPHTVPYVGNGSTGYILRNLTGSPANLIDNNTNVTYDGSNFVIYGADRGDGTFADSYIFGIKP